MEADRIIELKDEADLFVNKEVVEPIKDVEEFDNPVLVFFRVVLISRMMIDLLLCKLKE